MKINHTKILFIVLFFSFLLKLLALIEINNDGYCPPNDAFFNERASEELIFDKFPEKIRSYVPNTSYKIFLDSLTRIFGLNLLLIRAIQCLISIAVIPLVYLTGKKIFNKTAGLTASLFWAFNDALLLYDIQILKYSLTFSFTIITILCFIQLSEKRNLKYLFLTILLIIVLGKFRPIYFFLMLFIPHVYLIKKESIFFHINNLILLSVPFLSLLLIFIVPAAFLNHTGIHMYHGFNTSSNGFYGNIPYVRDNTLGHFKEGSILGKSLSEKFPYFQKIKNFWVQKSLYYIRTKPLASLKLTLRKLYYLFFFNDWNDTADILKIQDSFKSQKIAILKLFFIMPFILIGIFYSLLNAKKYRNFSLLNIFLFLPIFSILATCLTKRYQSQLIPVFSIYSGIGFSLLLSYFKKQKFFISLFIIIYVLFYAHSFNIKKLQTKFNYYNPIPYHNYRMKTHIASQKTFKKWLNNEYKLSFQEFSKMIDDFISLENTIDATGSLKKWIFETKLNEELNYCYRQLGTVYFMEESFDESILWYEKAFNLENSSDIRQKINEVTSLLNSRNSIHSYP